MPVWKSAGRMVAYDASASGRTLLRRYDADVAIGRKSATYDDNAARPVTAHPYDHSAAIRPQNTMAVRSDVQKPYDANLMKSTMSKKFVTFRCHSDSLDAIPLFPAQVPLTILARLQKNDGSALSRHHKRVRPPHSSGVSIRFGIYQARN